MIDIYLSIYHIKYTDLVTVTVAHTLENQDI